MEKLLRFKDSNGDEVYYPFSSFLGISMLEGDSGYDMFRLHFKPMRVTTQTHAKDSPSNVDRNTDTISFTIDGISSSKSIVKAVRNFLRAVYANDTGVVDVFIMGQSSIVTNAFTSKREEFNRHCTPDSNLADCSAGITAWSQVMFLSIVDAAVTNTA